MPTCYHCKSSQVKKISAIISQGTQNIELGHGIVGIGASKKGLGIGGARGKTGGQIKSALVKKLEKKKPVDGFIALFGAIVFAIFAFFINTTPGYYIFGVIAVFCLALFLQARRTYPGQLDLFNNTWYCYTCGDYSVTKSSSKKK